MTPPPPASRTDWSAEPESFTVASALRREIDVVARGRYTIASCVGICFLVAALYNFGARPLYQASAVISLDVAGASSLSARAAVDSARKDEALGQQVRVMQSPELALMAITDADPAIRAELERGPVSEGRGRILQEARYRLGLSPRIGTSPPDLVEAFRSRLVVEYARPATWVYVRFNAFDPRAGAAAVNRFLEIYQRETEKETAGAAGATRQQIERMVTERQGNVVEAIGKLESFDAKEGLRNVETRRDFLQKELARLQDALIAARQQRLSRRALYDEVQRGGDLSAIPSIRDDPEVAAVRGKLAELESKMAQATATLGERHPEIVGLRSEAEFQRQRMAQRVATVKDSIERDYRNAQGAEGDISAAIAGTQAQLNALDKTSVERSFIQKQAEAGQEAVGELISKSVKEADEAIYFTPRILQRAEPATAPSSPQTGRNFQLAITLGLVVGLVLALLRAHLDETLKTPEDVKAAFGVPLLGMVPRVTAQQFDLLGTETPVTQRLFEAYRVLRTNLTLGAGTGRANRCLMVTSSRESEGKTTTSMGLAVSLAQNGARVLLVDADLRRASLSRLIGFQGSAGLAGAIDGEAVANCVVSTRVPGLSLMPAGSLRQSPAETLNRAELLGVVAELKSLCDWVIVDAPPVLAVADAAILCRAMDEVLVVIGANLTPVGSVRATLDQLSAVGASIRGLILNRVDLSRDSHYYRYYYSAHYAGYGDSNLERADGRMSGAARDRRGGDTRKKA